MLNFDQNNAAVFAGTTGNGADLAVVVGRDHRCLPASARPKRARKVSGKRLLTAYYTTPADHHQESDAEDMQMSSASARSQRWQQQPAPASQTGTAVAPAIWATLIIQQSL